MQTKKKKKKKPNPHTQKPKKKKKTNKKTQIQNWGGDTFFVLAANKRASSEEGGNKIGCGENAHKKI